MCVYIFICIYLSICLSVCLSIFFYLFVRPSVCLFSLFCLSVYLYPVQQINMDQGKMTKLSLVPWPTHHLFNGFFFYQLSMHLFKAYNWYDSCFSPSLTFSIPAFLSSQGTGWVITAQNTNSCPAIIIRDNEYLNAASSWEIPVYTLRLHSRLSGTRHLSHWTDFSPISFFTLEKWECSCPKKNELLSLTFASLFYPWRPDLVKNSLQRKAGYICIKFPYDWNQNHVPYIRLLFIFINLWTVEKEEDQESTWGCHFILCSIQRLPLISYWKAFWCEYMDLQLQLPSSHKDKGEREGRMKHIQICKNLLLWFYNTSSSDLHDTSFPI